MPDNVQLGLPVGAGATVATDELAGGVQVQRVKIGFGGDGVLTDVESSAPLPVSVSGTLPVSGPLTDAQLRAAAVPVSFTWSGLTDAQLRASAVSIVEPATILTGAAAQTAVVNNILEAASGPNGTDISNARAASVQVVSTGTGGTFIFEQSNDNVNWVALPVFNAALVTGVPITAAITASASQIIYTFPLRCRFLRLRIATIITGGTIQAFSRISSEPWTTAAQLVTSNTAANLAATVSGTVTANAGTGTLAVSLATNTPTLAAGTNLAADVGVQYRANATGAASFVSVQSPATPAAATVKGTGGRLLGWQLQNSSAGVRSVKVFAVAAPTLGTTAAAFEIDIPAGGRSEINLPGGMAFGTACTYSVTSAKGLTDNTATGLAANDVSGSFFFA